MDVYFVLIVWQIWLVCHVVMYRYVVNVINNGMVKIHLNVLHVEEQLKVHAKYIEVAGVPSIYRQYT